MNWSIVALDIHTQKDDLESVVYQVHWSAWVKDGEHSASVIGADSLPDPSPESFTPLDELEKDTVLGWLHAKLGEERLAQIEESLLAQIEDKKHPKMFTLRPKW